MTPEQLDKLREQLPPFGSTQSRSELLDNYCRFYSLDFAEHRPGIEHQFGTVNSGNYKLSVHFWRQTDALANLFVVHGYFDHTGLFDKLIAWGLAHQCNVLVLDLPGHGLSTGDPAVIDDFQDYGRALADVLAAVELPDLPLWAMGQSTGGSALIEFARHYSWPFVATVLLAPLVKPAGWFGVNLAQRLLAPFTESVPRSFASNSSDHTFLEFVKRDPLQCKRVSLRWIAALRSWLRGLQRRDLGVGTVLVIQGDKDHTVGWRYNMPFVMSLFPGSHVAYLPGAGHQLANESPGLRRKYFQLVLAHLNEKGILLKNTQE